jgi:hypothetical protein
MRRSSRRDIRTEPERKRRVASNTEVGRRISLHARHLEIDRLQRERLAEAFQRELLGRPDVVLAELRTEPALEPQVLVEHGLEVAVPDRLAHGAGVLRPPRAQQEVELGGIEVTAKPAHAGRSHV